MKHTFKIAGCLAVISSIFFSSCKKTDDTFKVSKPNVVIGSAVSDASPLCGSIKGYHALRQNVYHQL